MAFKSRQNLFNNGLPTSQSTWSMHKDSTQEYEKNSRKISQTFDVIYSFIIIKEYIPFLIILALTGRGILIQNVRCPWNIYTIIPN